MSDHLDFDTDAALSADLDGELDAYAHELGTDADLIRARLSSTPGIEARRSELQRVRDHLRTPVPPLDELSRARLLGAALAGPSNTSIDTLTPRRPTPWIGRAVAAAVVVLALVGGGYLVSGTGTSDPASKSASSTRTTGTVASGSLGDLGALSRDQIDRLIGGPKSGVAVPAPIEQSPTADSAPQFSAGTAPDPSASATKRSAADLASPDQVTACRSAYEKLGTIQFDASGTYQGQPAVVLGINRGPRVIVFVVAAGDCQRVLLSLSR